MKKATLRQGMSEFFPSDHYIEIMDQLIKAKTNLRYVDFKDYKNSIHGIKLRRMAQQGLIEKVERGLYQITPYGRKIMAAVEAYKKEMAKK